MGKYSAQIVTAYLQHVPDILLVWLVHRVVKVVWVYQVGYVGVEVFGRVVVKTVAVLTGGIRPVSPSSCHWTTPRTARPRHRGPGGGGAVREVVDPLHLSQEDVVREELYEYFSRSPSFPKTFVIVTKLFSFCIKYIVEGQVLIVLYLLTGLC